MILRIEIVANRPRWHIRYGGCTSKQEKAKKSSSPTYGAKVATAELETNEVQDLADSVAEIKKAAAGQQLRFKVSVELGDNASVPQGVLDQVNALLAKIKAGWKLG